MVMAQFEMPSWHMLKETEVTHANLYRCSHLLDLLECINC